MTIRPRNWVYTFVVIGFGLLLCVGSNAVEDDVEVNDESEISEGSDGQRIGRQGLENAISAMLITEAEQVDQSEANASAFQGRAEEPNRIRELMYSGLDDVLDEGITLASIREKVMDSGAKAFYSAVLADKAIGKPKPFQADFVGLTLPNRYVFGFGMDIQDAWRNLPAIYAIKN